MEGKGDQIIKVPRSRSNSTPISPSLEPTPSNVPVPSISAPHGLADPKKGSHSSPNQNSLPSSPSLPFPNSSTHLPRRKSGWSFSPSPRRADSPRDTFAPSTFSFIPLFFVSFLSFWWYLVCLVISFLRIGSFCQRFFPDLYWALTRPVKAPSDYYEVKKAVMSSQAVLAAVGYITSHNVDVKSRAEGRFKTTLDNARMRKANQLFDAMAAHPRVIFIRGFSYVLRKLSRWVYPFGVHISEEEAKRVLEAAKKGPILIIPTHKSHVDSVLVTLCCFDSGLPIPYVVADEGLNYPIVGSIMRACGALFLPRSFSGETDCLSKTLFQEYLKALFERGHSIECFIEGGRSKTGKVLQPRVGILQRVVEWVVEEDRRHVFVVPIALTYDRIVENDSHLADNLSGNSGGKKKAEKFASSLRSLGSWASSVMNVQCFGRVDLGIAEPFDLCEYLQECVAKMRASSRRDIGRHNPHQLTRHLARAVGYQTLYLCNKASVAEPASLVATILLCQSKRGIDIHELRVDVCWLRNLILHHGGQVVSYWEEYIDVVLTLILEPIVGKNHLVKKHKNLLMVDLYSPEERLELSLYVNQILHLFVESGIVSLALYKHYKVSDQIPSSSSQVSGSQSDDEKKRVKKKSCKEGVLMEDLMEDIRFLSSLLKYEFIFSPLSPIESTVQQTISFLAERGTLEYYIREEGGGGRGKKKSGEKEERGGGERQGVLSEGEWEPQHKRTMKFEERRGMKQAVVAVGKSIEAQETYLFYATLFWRFLDSYWLVCLGFFYLLPDRVVKEDNLLNFVQSIGENLYFDGQLDLFEALTRDTLMNAVSLFLNWEIIGQITIEGENSSSLSHLPGHRVLRLTQANQNEAALEKLVCRIEQYRKSLRAYRSRRFLVRHSSETKDAIAIVRNSVVHHRSPRPSGGREPVSSPSSNRFSSFQLNSQTNHPNTPQTPSESPSPRKYSRPSSTTPFVYVSPPREKKGQERESQVNVNGDGEPLVSFLRERANSQET